MRQPLHQPTIHSPKPPTAAQLGYLRHLADRTGTTFAMVTTSSEAAREIDRLKVLVTRAAQSDTTERGDDRRERREAVRELNERPDEAARVRPHEIEGYGSSATWKDRA